MRELNTDKLKIVRLSEEYIDTLTIFDCINEDERTVSGYKAKKRRKFLAYSENINHF